MRLAESETLQVEREKVVEELRIKLQAKEAELHKTRQVGIIVKAQ